MGWFLVPVAIIGAAIGVLAWTRRGNSGSESFDVQSVRDVGGQGGDGLHPGSGGVAGKIR
jgi:hypothetical protein